MKEKKVDKGDSKQNLNEDVRMKAYFNRIFGESSKNDEERVLIIAKWALFALLFIVEIFGLVQGVERLVRDHQQWLPLVLLFSVILMLNIVEILKLFILPADRHKILFTVVEIIAGLGFIVFVEGVYSVLLYMLLLTQFYFAAKDLRTATWILCIALPFYAISYTVQVYITKGDVNSLQLFRESFASLIGFTVHFIAVQIVMAFYRQYIKLSRTLKELDENKRELEKAYAVVAEVTALEERQRIAKDIHDTAGHSLATVIMQTEAARRIIDDNPQDAKMKIAAANLQARHTLDRLRESIHLLSGSQEQTTLKSALEAIIHETMDGTEIAIRSDIEDVEVSDAKFRFLCNTLKEGLSNGLRHGHATAFWFELKGEGEEIHFLLSDNGKGMEKDIPEGFGLTTMREKANSLGGKVQVVSEPDEGFELSMILPKDAKVGYERAEN